MYIYISNIIPIYRYFTTLVYKLYPAISGFSVAPIPMGF